MAEFSFAPQKREGVYGDPFGDLGDSTGWDFSLCQRNAVLEAKGMKPTLFSTGTTIVGAVCQSGVCMAADSLSTSNTMIANEFSRKLYYLNDYCWAAGAGTAGDIRMTVKYLRSQAQLHEYTYGTQCTGDIIVALAVNYLYRYMGYIGAHLLIADFAPHKKWEKGEVPRHLTSSMWSVSADGAHFWGPWAAQGSGMLVALTHIEANYRIDMTVEECQAMLREAVRNSQKWDPSSGGYKVFEVAIDHTGFKQKWDWNWVQAASAQKAIADDEASGWKTMEKGGVYTINKRAPQAGTYKFTRTYMQTTFVKRGELIASLESDKAVEIRADEDAVFTPTGKNSFEANESVGQLKVITVQLKKLTDIFGSPERKKIQFGAYDGGKFKEGAHTWKKEVLLSA